MRLFLLRHGDAAPAQAGAMLFSDADRPLTDAGRRQVQLAASALRAIDPELRDVFTSPFSRAKDSAEIVSDVLGVRVPVTLEALAPGAPTEELVKLLQARTEGRASVVVGHEPELCSLAAHLVGSASERTILFERATLCGFEGALEPGECQIFFLASPEELEQLWRPES